MKILEMRALRGPNYYHRLPVIFMKLDLEELEYRPSDTIPDFRERLAAMMPTLLRHTCSPGVAGGFFQRLERGTWAGHIVEHIAIELQELLGHNVTFGKTFTKEPKGVYHVVFRYRYEPVGLRAGEMAVEIIERLYAGEGTDIQPLLAELRLLEEQTRLGPSTRAIVEEASRRGIAHYRLNEHSFIQLGQGKHQRRIVATLMDDTSALWVELASDKERTKQILGEHGIPVPRGRSVTDLQQALQAARDIGFPVVVKPIDGNHGRGVSVNLRTEDEVRLAVELAQNISRRVIVEQFIPGFDYRFLLIDGKLVAAALRQPAFVVGDGDRTVRELIEQLNEDPERGVGHEKNLTRVTIDEETYLALEHQQVILDDVIAPGRTVYVKSTANISSGGTAVDVTDQVHPHNRWLAERIAKLINLNVMGIDVMAPGVDRPFKDGQAAIIEVNAGPGFRMHLHPSQGTPRNVAKPVIDMLFPSGTPYSIPITAVTGTNGKTTTTRMIATILRHCGFTVGMTSTDAVEIDNRPILYGDYSGPGGAQVVLQDPSVDQAVLEVARGGILRRGLGYQWADVGVILNVTSDHLGLGGVENLKQLARVKSTVTEAVKRQGHAVFNADDVLVLKCMKKARSKSVLFSRDPDHTALKENLTKGSYNVTLSDGSIVIQKMDEVLTIARLDEIPATYGGKVMFNADNAMAAVAATYAQGITPEQIREGLMAFQPTIDSAPGRMNLVDVGDFKVLIDYGHNVAAIRALNEFVRGLMPGRIIRMAAGVGDRRTEDIIAFGRLMAFASNHVIVCDPSPRRRKVGETPLIVKEGLIQGGMKEDQIDIVVREREATAMALGMANPGDLVILQVENIQQVIQDVLDFKRKYNTQKIDETV